MYYVKVEGEKISDLIKGLERHLKELGGIGEITSNVKVKAEKLSNAQLKTLLAAETDEDTSVEEDDDGVEVVEEITFANEPRVITGDLDAEGLPWDERIHASSKSFVKNGTWKIKRGVSDESAAAIKSEYRQHSTPITVAPVIAQPVYFAPPVEVYTAPVVQAAPVVHVTPAIPQMQGNGHTLDSFKNNFPMVIATLITNGKLDQPYIQSLNAFFKIDQIWQASDEQKAMCFDTFATAGLITKV